MNKLILCRKSKENLKTVKYINVKITTLDTAAKSAVFLFFHSFEEAYGD